MSPGTPRAYLQPEVLRNQRLSQEAQERTRILVETSPAAVLTVSEEGLIELANHAATDLLAPRDGRLIGEPIAAFLPDLHRAAPRRGTSIPGFDAVPRASR